MGRQKFRGLLVQLSTDWSLLSILETSAVLWRLDLQVSGCTFSNSLKISQNPSPLKINARAFKVFLWFKFHIGSSFWQFYITFAIYRIYPWEWCSGVTEISFKNHHVFDKFTVQFGDSFLVILVNMWPVGHFLDSMRANNRSKCWAREVCTPLE